MLSIQKGNNPAYNTFLKRRLTAYGTQFITNKKWLHSQKVNWYLKDRNGKVCGGLIGECLWGALHIDYLWISPLHREQGYGKKLLAKAEKEAQKLGCYKLLVQTASYHAPDFYQEYGFETIGVVENYPVGHRFYYMEKLILI